MHNYPHAERITRTFRFECDATTHTAFPTRLRIFLVLTKFLDDHYRMCTGAMGFIDPAPIVRKGMILSYRHLLFTKLCNLIRA